MYHLPMNKINIIPVGSGSTGNSIYIEINEHKILMDMGMGFRKIRDALSVHNRNIADIEAIFLTHGHSDHVKGAKAIANNTNCIVYGNESCMYPIRDIKAERMVIETDRDLAIFPDLKVRMFRVPHDYVYTCGYTFESNGRKLSYLTDCGIMNDKIFKELSGSDVCIIESNHDIEMLQNGPYPRELQRRILSEYGHLSNDDCATTISRLYEAGTRNFLLAHLSRQNNTPEKALETLMSVMKEKDINVYVCPVEGNDLLSY